MLSAEEIRALPDEDRAFLVKQLGELADAENSTSPTRIDEDARRRFLLLLIFASGVMIPWIVFLSVTLPRHYVTSRWGATWVGFDIAVTASLGSVAVFAWRRYQAVIVAALVASTLLATDAWFDIMTSSGRTNVVVSVATAVVVELPMAVLLFLVAYRLLHVAFQQARAVAREPGPLGPMWRAPLGDGGERPGTAL